MRRVWQVALVSALALAGCSSHAAAPAARAVKTVQHSDAEIFMKLSANRAKTQMVRRALSRSHLVGTYAFLTQADAMREFRRLYADQPDLVASTTADQLPTSFPVTLVKGATVADLKRAFRSLAGVDEVVSRRPGRGLDPEMVQACASRDRHPDADVEIFMDISATGEQVAAVRDALSASPVVRSAEFVSHEDALREFQTIFVGKPDLLRGTTALDLPTSFRVDLVDDVPHTESLTAFQAIPGVDEIKIELSAAACGGTSS